MVTGPGIQILELEVSVTDVLDASETSTESVTLTEVLVGEPKVTKTVLPTSDILVIGISAGSELVTLVFAAVTDAKETGVLVILSEHFAVSEWLGLTFLSCSTSFFFM